MTVPKPPLGASARHFAWLSIAAACATIALKTLAWWTTGSVGLLSDALESCVNLAGASFALWMIVIARRPPDDEHPFGHAKAEYFSSGFEGVLIFGAAAAIVATAVQRLFVPQPLVEVGTGLAVSAVATAINLGVAIALRRASRRFGSVALEADARHLATDVVTSIGVIAGVAAVWATGWLLLDPLIAIGVGVNILFEGVRLMRASVDGLMDRSLDEPEQARLREALDGFAARGVRWRALRTRRAGTDAWIDVVVLVPGDWTVAVGHDVADEVEATLAGIVRGATVVTHLEPIEPRAEPSGPGHTIAP
ncbi:MAG TPA: cation diffusion facilitator family transporter [Burkholderiaceae bacterium]|nr:cation diffusion facilitator family transporter [Burkholderiaceae bacterium]